MAIFGRSEDFEFERVGSPVVKTISSYYDSAISRCALAGINSATAGWIAHDLGDFEDFWLSIRVYATQTTPINGRTPLVLYDAENVARYRFVIASGGWQPQRWNGDAWVNAGSPVYSYVSGETRTIAVRVDQANGKITTYSDNFPVSVSDVDMSSWGGIRKAALLSWCDNDQHAFSEFIWGDEPILFHRYVTRWPTANGDLTDGTGGYGDVDEVALSDIDAIVLDTAGHSKTFTRGSATLPTGDVRSVKVSSRVGNVPSEGAQNVKARLRKSGTNYDQSSNFAGIADSKALYEAYWTQDPATSANWTRENAASTALQFGLVAQS